MVGICATVRALFIESGTNGTAPAAVHRGALHAATRERSSAFPTSGKAEGAIANGSGLWPAR